MIGMSKNDWAHEAANNDNVLSDDSSPQSYTEVSPIICPVMPVVSAVILNEPEAPLYMPHLFWDCVSTWESDGSTIPISASLVDHGSHAVLIHPDLVRSLNVEVKKMPNPEAVKMVMGDGNVKVVMLDSYVSLFCQIQIFCGLRKVYAP